MKWCNNRKCFLELNPWCVWSVRVNEESKTSYVDRCSWCTTPCTVRRGRRPRRRWSRRTASCCCTTCTRSCCWCTRCRWLSWRTASGTAWRCGWLKEQQFRQVQLFKYLSASMSSVWAWASQWESEILWLNSAGLWLYIHSVAISRKQKITDPQGHKVHPQILSDRVHKVRILTPSSWNFEVTFL